MNDLSPALQPPPRSTANPSPPRPANSVRRTSSIDVDWPDGLMGARRFSGRARDYLTGSTGKTGIVLADASYEAGMDFQKNILSISADPPHAAIAKLEGARAGNHLRILIAETLPHLIESADPLYLLLDDMSGVALVSNWSLTQWFPGAMERMHEFMPKDQLEKMMDRTGVCWGLQEGSTGITGGLGNNMHQPADAAELRNPADPDGWHAFPERKKACFRRARRIDVSIGDSDGLLYVDASFQDSTTTPEGGRVAVHEYNLRVTADAETLTLFSIEPEPRILPFPECPGAVANTQRLIGTALPDIRANVLANLRGPAGCTHLNDALRALAEVPKLAAMLPAR